MLVSKVLIVLVCSCFRLTVAISRFPTQEDFDYVENLIDSWKVKQTNGPFTPGLSERSKGTIKIGSFAPSSTRLVEHIDSGYAEPQSTLDHSNGKQVIFYQSPYGLTYGQPPIIDSSNPGHPYYYHHIHPQHQQMKPYTYHDHSSELYSHHDHESHEQHDNHHYHQHHHKPKVSSPSKSSSPSSSSPIVRQQTVESDQRVIQYVPLSVNPRQYNRSPATSPWLWSLLFVIIFPTLLGAILLPLALVFLTNVVFVLLMLRNNGQQTTIIPNTQTKNKPRFINLHGLPMRVDEDRLKFILNLIRRAETIYGPSKDLLG